MTDPTSETPPPPPAPAAIEEQPPAPNPPAPVLSHVTERTWALTAHLTTLSNYVGVPGFIGPLIIWLTKKDDAPFAAAQAKEALNFQLSLYLYVVICIALFWLIIPPFLIPVIGIAHVIFTIVAALSVSEDKPYRYPATIRFL